MAQAQKKPWEMTPAEMAAASAPTTAIGGPIVIGRPSPKAPYEGPTAAVDLDRRRTDQAINAATQADQIRKAKADADRAQSDAATAKAKADDINASQRFAAMAPTADITGEAYLRKFVSPDKWNLVRAYARGDVGARSGGLSTSMLPTMQDAINYDHSFSATTFPARQKMQQDLAGSDPKTLGGGLRAGAQMLAHGKDLLESGAALDNYGPGFIGHIGNILHIMGMKAGDDPKLTAYNQNVLNYAPESQKGVAGSAGIGAERGERQAAYAPTESQASRAAALQQDAKMMIDRSGALNDQYKRLLGKDIVDLLSPTALKNADEIMAGGYDSSGKAMHPAPGYTPGSLIGIGGIPGGGPSGGDGPGAGTPPSLAGTGAMRTEADPDRGAAVEAAIRNGMAPEDIAKQFPGTDISAIPAIQAGLKRDPNYKFSVNATKEVPQTLLNRIVSNPGMVGTMSALDAIMPMGIYGQDARDAMEKAKEAAPTASLIGSLIGGVPAVMGGEALAGKGLAKLAPSIGADWIPRAADAAYGALQGYGSADDGSGAAGAAEGAGVGLLSGMFGRNMLRQAGATVRGLAGQDAAEYLRSQGVPLTVGQYVGGAAKQAEDQATGYLGIGGIIKARRDEGLTGFNQAAFNQGSLGDPLVTNIGERGAAQMDDAVTRAYAPLDNAQVTLDPQLNRDLADVRSAAHLIPGRGADYDYLAGRYLDPNLPAVGATVPANNLQEASRLMRAGGAGQGAGVNFPGPFRDATNDAASAVDAAISRSSPEAAASLAQGNTVYRNQSILDEAVKAARATRGPDGDAMFMPSQLANASVANANKYDGRSLAATADRPFYDLTTAGQEILPSKVGDPGTAGRLMLGLGATALAGGGAGLGAMDGGGWEGAGEGGGAGLGTLATLAGAASLGGSRTGQRAIIAALADRPDVLRRIGAQVYDSAGSIGGPLAIPAIVAAQQRISAP